MIIRPDSRDGGTRTCMSGALAAVSVLALGAGTPAAAQETSTASTADVQEIVVTARYREENLQTTPLAITALTMDAIEQRNFTSVDDLGLVVPNAFFRPPVSNYGPTQTIGLRGIIQTDFTYSFEPAVGIYIDDVYHGTLTGSSFDLMDLERVEVLRGPQGTLFGKNSLGGSIRLISRKPQGDGTASVEATYGQFDRLDVKAVGDFALIEDRLFARIVGVSKRRDGHGKYLDFTCDMIRRGTPHLAGIGDGLGPDGPDADLDPDPVPVGSPEDNAFSLPMAVDPRSGDCALGTLGGQNVQAARVMLRALASDRLELNFAADYTSQTNDPPVETLLTPRGGAIDNFYSNNVVYRRYGIQYTTDERFLTGDPYTNYANYGDIVNGKYMKQDQTLDAWGVSGIADYRLTDSVAAKLILAYRTYDAAWSNDSDMTPFALIQTDVLQEHEQIQAEIQLSGTLLNDRFEWTTGLFYYDAESRVYNTTGFEGFQAFGSLQNFVTDDAYTNENFSGFVHANFRLTDRIAISGGVRYTDEQKSNTFRHYNQIVVDEPLEFGDSRVDYKVGIDFQATDDMFFYAQVATGFRSPGSTPRIFTPGQLKPIPGEEVVNYELGGKLDLFDRRLRINTALFYMDYDPRLVQINGTQCNAYDDPDPGPLYQLAGGVCPPGTPMEGTIGFSWFFYTSVPATVKGAELELTAFPIDGLAFNYSLGYNEFEVDAEPGDQAYRHPSSLVQPEWNMSAGLQYAFRLADRGTLTPRVDWFYQSHRTNGPINLPQIKPDWIIPSYGIYNARLTYVPPRGDWSLALSGTNITDKFYWQQLGPATTATGAVSAARAGTPGRPREWAITFRKDF